MEKFSSKENKDILWDLIGNSRPYSELDQRRAAATRAHFERTFENMAAAPDSSIMDTNKRMLVNVVGFMNASASVPTNMLDRIQNYAVPNKGEIDFTALAPINRNIPSAGDLQPVDVLVEKTMHDRTADFVPSHVDEPGGDLHAIARCQEDILREVREIKQLLTASK